MATKAERFKSATERSGPKRPKIAEKLTKGKRRAPLNQAAARELGGPTAKPPHNVRARAKKEETYAYEASAGRPSRKSTRPSDAHVKTGVRLQIRQIGRTHSPAARAKRGGS